MNENHKEHAFDDLVIPGSGAREGQTLHVLVSADLLKTQLQQPPLDIANGSEKDIVVVQDSSGNPMIFHISPAKTLMLMRRDAVAPSGWVAVDLLAAQSHGAVSAFDVSQDRRGRISVAFAVAAGEGGGTAVHQAAMLSSDPAAPHWANLFTATRLIGGIDPAFKAEAITQGYSDDDKAPLLVAVGNIGGVKYFYAAENPELPARKLELPENADPAKSNIKLALSHILGMRCISFLYEIGSTKSLVARSLSERSNLNFDFSAGNKALPAGLRNLSYTCLAPASARGNPLACDMYVGTGGGVYMFRDGVNRKLEKVAEGIGEVREIAVADDGDDISVWAMCAGNRLYYVHGTRGETYKWNAPILFSSSVMHIAALRSATKQSNEVFVVDQSFNVTHHWQDPNSTLWQSASLNLKGGGALVETEVFATRIVVEDEKGHPLYQDGKPETLRLSAAETTYATINGRVYCLDKENPVEVSADDQGQLMVIIPTKDISVPTLFVKPQNSAKTLSIRPNAGIRKKLASVNGASDLRGAVTKTGKPVVPENIGHKALEGAALQLASMNRLTAVDASSPHTFVSIGDQPAIDKLSFAAHTKLSMTYRDGAWVDSAVATLPPARSGSFLGEVEVFVGDALRHLEAAVAAGIEAIKEGARFVIEKAKEGVRFLIELGGNILDIVIDTLGAAFKAVNWLLKRIGIDLDKIIEWLGYIFDWKDIWNTHLIIASLLEGGIEFGLLKADEAIDNLKGSIDAGAEKLLKHLDSLTLSEDQKKMQQLSKGSITRSPESRIIQSNPGIGDFEYQVKHGGLIHSEGRRDTPAKVPPGWDEIKKSLEDILNDFQEFSGEFVKILSEPFSLESVFKLVVELGKLLVKALRDGAKLILNIFKALLHMVADLLTGALDAPILSSLYEWLGSLAGASGAKLSVLRGVCLLVAIPATIIHKIATGKAPFIGIPHLGSPDEARRFIPALFEKHRTRRTVPAMSGGLQPLAVAPFWASGKNPSWRDDYTPRLARRHIAYIDNGMAVGTLSAREEDLYDSMYRYYKYAGTFVGYPAKLVGGLMGFVNSPKCMLALNVLANVVTYPIPRRLDEPDTWAAFGAKLAWGQDVAYTVGIGFSLGVDDPTGEAGSTFRGGVKACTKSIGLVGKVIANIDGEADLETWLCDVVGGVGGIASGVGTVAKEPISKYAGLAASYAPAVYKIGKVMWSKKDDILQYVEKATTVVYGKRNYYPDMFILLA